MNWTSLNSKNQIEDIKSSSFKQPVLIFKHSTRCAISSMALNRLERYWDLQDAEIYFLDLIQFRDVSSAVAEEFEVMHQSPQVLVIQDGKCIFSESHMGISYDTIKPVLQVTGV